MIPSITRVPGGPDERSTCSVQGAIATAAIVRHLLQPEDYPLFIALGRALSAIQVNHEDGAGPQDSFNTDAAFAKIKKTLHPTDPNQKEPSS